MVEQSKIDSFISQWSGSNISELKSRLKTLKSKSKTDTVIAETKAIQALIR